MTKGWMKAAAAVCALLLWGTAQAGTVTYVYSDPQGTPLAEADANGNITATFDYRPYGTQALGQAPSGPGYTGHVNDPEIGLVYMQARYYDPEVGRFLSVDPVGPAAGNISNFSRYLYAAGNPISNTDPDGREDCSYFCRRMRALSDKFSGVGQGLMGNVSGSGAGPGGQMRATTTFINAGANLDVASGLQQAAEVTDRTISLAPGGAAAICMTDGCGSLQWMLAGVAAVVPGEGTLESVAGRRLIGITGEVGESALRSLLGGKSQVYFRTTTGGRFVDQLVNGAAHESKVGYTHLSADIRGQIAKDAELLQTGRVDSVTWHFFDSPVTGRGGASKPLRAALESNGIDVVRH